MKTNKQLTETIEILKKQSSVEGIGIWKTVASFLIGPTRKTRVVNLYKIDKYTKDNESIIVPGKVLGMGEINHKVKIAAFSFSKQAKDKLARAQGKTMTISEMIKENPKGKDIRIMG